MYTICSTHFQKSQINPENVIIAITGNIGSGKSTITKIIRELGFKVFDSDKEVKKALTKKDLIHSDLVLLMTDHDCFDYKFIQIYSKKIIDCNI